jgi:N-methylhydantoinase A/oxoprolinase/acetone carboxylase beta subunit
MPRERDAWKGGERTNTASPCKLVFASVRERLDADGNVLVALDEAQIHGIATDISRAGVQAVAVVFLHAFRNAEHEQRV